jgi:processive 1,2-diacylglycerol beta-glucosyltransferase
MPELLMRSHVLIGKAGGAATQEAIAAKTPMLVTKIVPGQEEGNATLLTESGCGALAFTRGATVGLLAELHANGGAMWKQWRENMGGISHPNAAREVAAFVMG